MMHKSSEIGTATAALGNQLAAGISLREAVGRMARLQPQYADHWRVAEESLSRGGRLSLMLEDLWPESYIAAVRAGEESGALEHVFLRIAKSMEVQAEVKKIFSKLISPIVAFLAGFGVFLFFMVAVIPKLQENLGGSESSLVFKASSVMHSAVINFWPVILGIVGVAGYLGYQWIKSPGSIDKLIEVGNQQAKLGGALRSLYFGLWAHQMALLDTAGLPVKQQLLLSAKTLPECYRHGIFRMASEVEKRGIAESADPEKQLPDDPRQEWPFYVVTAFITAHETGRLDTEMQRAAPILIDDGIKQLTQVLVVADLGAKVFASVMIMLPLMAYFSQLANSLTKAFS